MFCYYKVSSNKLTMLHGQKATDGVQVWLIMVRMRFVDGTDAKAYCRHELVSP